MSLSSLWWRASPHTPTALCGSRRFGCDATSAPSHKNMPMHAAAISYVLKFFCLPWWFAQPLHPWASAGASWRADSWVGVVYHAHLETAASTIHNSSASYQNKISIDLCIVNILPCILAWDLGRWWSQIFPNWQISPPAWRRASCFGRSPRSPWEQGASERLSQMHKPTIKKGCYWLLQQKS